MIFVPALMLTGMYCVALNGWSMLNHGRVLLVLFTIKDIDSLIWEDDLLASFG